MQKTYQYILFDLDGTLTDPKLGITKSVQYALRHFSIDVTNLDSLTPFIGPPLKDSFMDYYHFDEQNALEAIEKYREYFKETGIFENNLYSGMSSLLHKLVESGKTLLVATSKPTVFAERILEHFNISQYFVFISGSELDGTRSNKNEVIKYALEQNNISDLNNVVMVGDRRYDVLGAKEVGIDSIGVLYGYGDYEELTSAGATYLASNIKELTEILL
ncbi:HAD family hydrolase [Cellulosilyticum sp. I15G10I2]|uniref:HAD family hydrolase n=1 Tax=Cellulosilyticum sp. I15G10I2 TaxID=1892843 RepID=UPI00085CDC81|nr:HAD family hydrolase [Cellulosilyticum sp. I15G10I2]